MKVEPLVTQQPLVNRRRLMGREIVGHDAHIGFFFGRGAYRSILFKNLMNCAESWLGRSSVITWLVAIYKAAKRSMVLLRL
jgi:hypothetical protein